MLFIFVFSVSMIFYAYFGYPACLYLISLLGKRPAAQGSEDRPGADYEPPRVSLIIAAYNEQGRIGEKIEGSLAQDYPGDKLEIIVASDCSDDRTDEIVKTYADRGVRLVRAKERKGKENAQKHAVDAASGEILVFSDTATILRPDGISSIVRNFRDPAVGCVSSVDRFIDRDGNVSGEGAYVKYEMFLRGLESRVNTLVGLSGSFFAARREVCREWAVDLQSDFNTLLNSIRLGYRGVSDPGSRGYYKNLSDEKKEYDRKVRTVLRGISVMMRNLALLNPVRYGLFSWQLFSHKLCRWLVPLFMIAAFISNGAMVFRGSLYLCLFMGQLLFYGAGFVWSRRRGTCKNTGEQVMKLIYFFVTVNLSILAAWYKYVQGERAVFWEPSKR